MWFKKFASWNDVCTTTTHPTKLNNWIPVNNSGKCFDSMSQSYLQNIWFCPACPFPRLHPSWDWLSPTCSLQVNIHTCTQHIQTHVDCAISKVLCTLSCAKSYRHFSGALLHLFISFSTAVFSLFHNHLFSLNFLRNAWSESWLMANSTKD